MPIAGAAIGAAGSLAGGKMQSDAAGNAANAQGQAGRDSIAAQVSMYNQTRSDNLGRLIGGNAAFNELLRMYGLSTYTPDYAGSAGGITISGGEPTAKKKRTLFDKVTDPANLAGQFGGTSYDPMGFFSSGGGGGTTPMQFSFGGGGTGLQGTTTPGTGKADFSQFYQTPDYLVARDEGLRGLQNSANDFNPGGFGGRLDMDRMNFASNLGSKAFGNYQNSLFRLAGLGGEANSQLGALGQNTAQGVSNAYSNIGRANASGYLNQADAWSNALQGVGKSIGRGWGGSSGGSANSYQNNPGYLSPVQREPIQLQGW